MRKKIYTLLMAGMALLTACTDSVLVDEMLPRESADEMEVNISLAVVDEGGDTRSFVKGEEIPTITSMKLVCFDIDGLYVTVKDADAAALASKTIKATVPSSTVRIHFLANFSDLSLPSNVSVMREATLMRHRTMTVDYQHDMVYWGYHMESTAEQMKTWLATGTNKVWLLRDRAKVTLDHSDTNIQSIIWTFSNGLKRGLVAPRESNDDARNPYSNNYYDESTGKVDLVTTQFIDDEDFTYTVTTPASWDEAAYTAAGWTAGGDNLSQYLFGNRNVRYPVKLIARVTYTDNTVKFHALKLLNSSFLPVHVKRNEHYKLNLESLPKELGFDNVSDALNATIYSNDRFASVGKEVTSVNNGERFLTLTDGSLVFFSTEDDNTATATIQFKYTDADGNALTENVEFKALWLDKEGDNRPDVAVNASSEDETHRPQVQYDTTTGIGTITFTREAVTNEWKYNELRLICTHSGLYRDIDVFSCASAFSASLKQEGTEYKLTVQIPSTMPEAFFPQTLRMASKTLQPTGIDYDNTKVARVTVESTAVTGISNGAANTWNEGATTWNYWFEYPIEYRSDWTSGTYVVTLKDVRSSYDSSHRPTDVGLYVEMKSDHETIGTLRAVTP